MMKKFTYLIILLVILTACMGERQPLSSSLPDSGQQPGAQALPEAGSIEGPCVDGQDGVELLFNGDHGYCLLYPSGYDVARTGETGMTLFIDSLLNVEQPRVGIQVEDAAGRTAEQVADEIVAGLEGFEIERSNRMVGGVEAVVLDKLPGQEINRQVILVYGDRLYTLNFTPADKSLGERYEAMEAFYAPVIDSFNFLPNP